MDRTVTFAGTDLGTFGTKFSNGGSFPVPPRVYKRVSVLGRNGDVLIDSGKYDNAKITFPAYIYEDFRENYNDLVGFLSSKTGYQRIEDSLETDTYRLGVYLGDTDPSVKNSDTMGSFEISFDCKPQKFYKQDENGITAGASSAGKVAFSNPSKFTSKPLIKMYANSTLVIQGDSPFTLELGDVTQAAIGVRFAYIDCETLEVYSSGGNNLSSYLNIPVYKYGNEKFPFFEGEGTWTAYDAVSNGGSVIYPRWWTI